MFEDKKFRDIEAVVFRLALTFEEVVELLEIRIP